MRTTTTLFTLLLAFATAAQCPFTPTISPAAPILCPGESVVLGTQAYDTYQWYADGVAIDGATLQTLTIQPYAEVTVAATLDGCTELSAPVIVDGWVFLLPFVVHAGDEPLFIDFEGNSYHCVGDTVLLIFSYPENVQWTNNGQDLPGAINDTLVVTSSGNYSASGAPDICPNYVQSLGLQITVLFQPVIQPEIVPVDDQLCASPVGNDHQWYLNGEPLPGNTACIDGSAPGLYTVDVTYQIDCSIPSEPYLITNIIDITAARSQVHPVPASDVLYVQWPANDRNTEWQLFDALGRPVLAGSTDQRPTQTIAIATLPPGRYWLRADGTTPVPVMIAK